MFPGQLNIAFCPRKIFGHYLLPDQVTSIVGSDGFDHPGHIMTGDSVFPFMKDFQVNRFHLRMPPNKLMGYP